MARARKQVVDEVKVLVQTRLDHSVAKRLEAEAKKQQRSVAGQLAFIIREWLDKGDR